MKIDETHWSCSRCQRVFDGDHKIICTPCLKRMLRSREEQCQ